MESSFKKNVFNKTILIWPSRTHGAPICRLIVIRGGLSHKPGGFSRSPCKIDGVNFSNIEIRQINVDDDDDSNEHQYLECTLFRRSIVCRGERGYSTSYTSPMCMNRYCQIVRVLLGKIKSHRDTDASQTPTPQSRTSSSKPLWL